MIMTKISQLLVLIGFGLTLYSFFGDFKKTRTYDGYDMDKNLGLPEPYRQHMLSTQVYEDKKQKNTFALLGGVCMISGLILGSISYSQRKKRTIILTENTFSGHKQEVQNSKKENGENQIIYREIKSNKILKIILKNNQFIDSEVFLGDDIAADGEYEYLKDERKLLVRNGKIVSMSI